MSENECVKREYSAARFLTFPVVFKTYAPSGEKKKKEDEGEDECDNEATCTRTRAHTDARTYHY